MSKRQATDSSSSGDITKQLRSHAAASDAAKTCKHQPKHTSAAAIHSTASQSNINSTTSTNATLTTAKAQQHPTSTCLTVLNATQQMGGQHSAASQRVPPTRPASTTKTLYCQSAATAIHLKLSGCHHVCASTATPTKPLTVDQFKQKSEIILGPTHAHTQTHVLVRHCRTRHSTHTQCCFQATPHARTLALPDPPSSY